MPRKKNSAAQPIGRGKAGTGKRMIHDSGGGKKALKTWRGMSSSYRKTVKAASKRSGVGLTSYMRGHRTAVGKMKQSPFNRVRKPTSAKPR